MLSWFAQRPRQEAIKPKEITMRTMVRFSLPIEKGNQAYDDGALGKTLETLLAKLKPEAAYFCPIGGKRGGMFVFDMADSAQIPVVLEPLFGKLNAEVEISPVMNADDLKKGIAAAKAGG